jgi:hypothetical protein
MQEDQSTTHKRRKKPNMIQQHFSGTLLGALLATGLALTGTTAAEAAPTVENYLQEIKKLEGIPTELTQYIFNMEEKMLIETKTVEKMCQAGEILNSKGIPLFNMQSIQKYYDALEKQDYSSFGQNEKRMKIFASSIKLSAFIKTMTSLCKHVI